MKLSRPRRYRLNLNAVFGEPMAKVELTPTSDVLDLLWGTMGPTYKRAIS